MNATIMPKNLQKRLVDIIYYILLEWASKHDQPLYMPSKEWFMKIDIVLYDSIVFSMDDRSCGSFDATTMNMRICIGHEPIDIMCTAIHEFAHAVQFYNLGARWMPLYLEQNKTVGYIDNVYEVTARIAEDGLSYYAQFDKHLRDTIDRFNWISAFLGDRVSVCNYSYSKGGDNG